MKNKILITLLFITFLFIIIYIIYRSNLLNKIETFESNFQTDYGSNVKKTITSNNNIGNKYIMNSSGDYAIFTDIFGNLDYLNSDKFNLYDGKVVRCKFNVYDKNGNIKYRRKGTRKMKDLFNYIPYDANDACTWLDREKKPFRTTHEYKAIYYNSTN